MSLILKAAHQFHRFFPFAQLLTANWILKRNPTGALMPATPFGHEVQARTSVHVLLSIEGENWRVSFGADDIVRNKCPTALKEVMES